MFLNGENGKNQFLTAIKSGDFQGAGKYLVDGVKMGTDSIDSEMKTKGQTGGQNFADGVKGKEGGR